MSAEKHQNVRGTTRLQCGHIKLSLPKVDRDLLDKVVRTKPYDDAIILSSLGNGHSDGALGQQNSHGKLRPTCSFLRAFHW